MASGPDRRTYLHGLFTNDVASLTAGTGCYTAYLTAQGRMMADLWVYELGDLILLSMSGEVKDTVLARLDQFIFSEDVQIGDVTHTFGQVAIVGPSAPAILSGMLDGVAADQLSRMPEHANVRTAVDGQPAIVTRVTDTGEPGFDVYVERGQLDAFTGRLEASDVVRVEDVVAETLRVEAGVPVFHRDMDEETIPLEAGIESRAISLTKGCYVGQEVIIRVLHRGHGRVARRLVGVVFDGTVVPQRGTPLRVDGRDVGHVTTAVRSPALDRPIALAYVHRDFTTPGTVLSAGDAAATVSPLPFVAR